MIFLIEYDRPKGQLVKFKSFVDAERLKAQDMRLELELSLHRSGVDHEVVLLEAANEAAVRQTHRRYFEKLADLAKPAKGASE
jgi:hypothetical protein